MTALLTFDRIATGDEFGTLAIDPESSRGAFAHLFPTEANVHIVPPAHLLALLMRGYLGLLPDRPPGNVHAGQRLTWAMPALYGTALSVGLRCVNRQLKNGRRWLWFEVRLCSARGTHLTAINATIWGG